MTKIPTYSNEQLTKFSHIAIRKIAEFHRIKSPSSKTKGLLIQQILLCQEGKGGELIYSSQKRTGRPNKQDFSSEKLIYGSINSVGTNDIELKQNEILSFITTNDDNSSLKYNFDELIAVMPYKRLSLTNNTYNDQCLQIIDDVSPLGFGQRCLISVPTSWDSAKLLTLIGNAIKTNSPNIKVILLTVNENPESITYVRDNFIGEVEYSSFDYTTSRQIEIAEQCINKCRNEVEQAKNTVLLINNIAKLSEAYKNFLSDSNNETAYVKKFFGSGRQIRNGGSLTVIATVTDKDNSLVSELTDMANVRIFMKYDNNSLAVDTDKSFTLNADGLDK